MNDDDLLDDSESIFMVDTRSSSHRMNSTHIAYMELDRNATPNSTKALQALLQEKNRKLTIYNTLWMILRCCYYHFNLLVSQH